MGGSVATLGGGAGHLEYYFSNGILGGGSGWAIGALCGSWRCSGMTGASTLGGRCLGVTCRRILASEFRVCC
eukprot:scaffold80937_cov51-Attheya_sp.AAC.1